MEATNLNYRPDPDEVLVRIADYVHDYRVTSAPALDTARLCLLDSLACAFDALADEECLRLLGPTARPSPGPSTS